MLQLAFWKLAYQLTHQHLIESIANSECMSSFYHVHSIKIEIAEMRMRAAQSMLLVLSQSNCLVDRMTRPASKSC